MPFTNRLTCSASPCLAGAPVKDPEPFPVETRHELQLFLRRPCWEEMTGFGALSFGLRGHLQLLERVTLERGERVLSMTECRLSQSPGARPEPMLVVGTGFVFPRGENYRAMGRVLVFRIQHVNVHVGKVRYSKAGTGGEESTNVKMEGVDDQKKRRGLNVALEEGRAEAAKEETTLVPSLRLVHIKKYPGAVSAITTLATAKRRYIVVAAGMSVLVNRWEEEVLMECGLLLTDRFTTSLVTVGNFIIATDAQQGCVFSIFREADDVIELLAADPWRCLPVTTAAPLVHGDNLGVLLADEDKNFSILRYNIRHGGDTLQCIGDFHLGSRVASFAPLQLLPFGDSKPRIAALYGTLDGGVGCLTPLGETEFKILLALQKVMTYFLPHVAGLNPKSFR